VVQRVQDAFAEGRLDDAEFDERTRAALTARTHADPGRAHRPDARGPGPPAGRRPVIQVRGIAYQGAVEITTRPPERPALPG
jgi:uncharacterized protein DUF1707